MKNHRIIFHVAHASISAQGQLRDKPCNLPITSGHDVRIYVCIYILYPWNHRRTHVWDEIEWAQHEHVIWAFSIYFVSSVVWESGDQIKVTGVKLHIFFDDDVQRKKNKSRIYPLWKGDICKRFLFRVAIFYMDEIDFFFKHEHTKMLYCKRNAEMIETEIGCGTCGRYGELFGRSGISWLMKHNWMIAPRKWGLNL